MLHRSRFERVHPVRNNIPVAVYAIAASTPSIAFSAGYLCGAVFEQVSVIGCDHDHAASFPGFAQDGQEQAQIFQVPSLV